MKEKLTLKGLADLVGTSRTTVSLVLNDRWREQRISPEVAARVRSLAEAHHFRPNGLVKALQSGCTKSVSLMLPSLRGHYYPDIVQGVEEEARKHGYHLLISRMFRGLEEEEQEIEALLERRVDGLILYPRYGERNRANYRRLIAQGVPLVFLDGYFPDVPCPAVLGDDEKGAFAATSHLIRLGHRRLAYVGISPQPDPHLADRHRGFTSAMEAHGLAAGTETVIGMAPEQIQWALSGSRRPTALLAATDFQAMLCMKVARAGGLRLPTDLAVIGFSDCVEHVDEMRTPLTTVRVDAIEMGRRAFCRLLDEIKAPGSGFSLERLPAELVVRKSCGARLRGRRLRELNGSVIHDPLLKRVARTPSYS